MIKVSGFLFFVFFVSFLGFGCQKSPYYAEIKGHRIYLEVADNPESRERGLQFRNSLEINKGMLFIFPQEEVVSFWMKNTFIPLDIAFIDSFGKIVQTDSMEPRLLLPVESIKPVKYALEVNRGFLSDRSIGEGDTLLFSRAIADIIPE